MTTPTIIDLDLILDVMKERRGPLKMNELIKYTAEKLGGDENELKGPIKEIALQAINDDIIGKKHNFLFIDDFNREEEWYKHAMGSSPAKVEQAAAVSTNDANIAVELGMEQSLTPNDSGEGATMTATPVYKMLMKSDVGPLEENPQPNEAQNANPLDLEPINEAANIGQQIAEPNNQENAAAEVASSELQHDNHSFWSEDGSPLQIMLSQEDDFPSDFDSDSPQEDVEMLSTTETADSDF